MNTFCRYFPFLFSALIVSTFHLSCSNSQPSPPVRSRVELFTYKSGVCGVNVQWKTEGLENIKILTLYRSFLNLEKTEVFDLNRMPITIFKFESDSSEETFCDSFTAHNCTYYYYLEVEDADSGTICSNFAPCTVDNIVPFLIPGSSVSIYIDKLYYYLELRTENESIKRYPISLGANPKKRKLHQDNLSTPEGNYRISYVNLNSSFYKSMKINYPNQEDRKRWESYRFRKTN